MDNATLDITSEGVDTLHKALSIAFAQHSTAKYFAVIENTLVFFWARPSSNVCTITDDDRATLKRVEFEVHSFLTPVDSDRAADNAIDWLTLDSGAQWDDEPDHDGDNGKGWRVFNESWGHVYGMWEGICAVAPAWAMYGK